MLQTVSYSQAIRWMEVAQWVARLIRYRSVLGPNPYNGSLKLCWKLLNNVNQRIDWSSWCVDVVFYNFTTYMYILMPNNYAYARVLTARTKTSNSPAPLSYFYQEVVTHTLRELPPSLTAILTCRHQVNEYEITHVIRYPENPIF